MSSFRIRPYFTQTVDLEIEALREQVARRINRDDARVEAKSFPGYLSLRIPEKDQHFWSPQLNLSLEPTEDGQTVINGIYGPNTNVWSMFLYSYLFVGSVGLFTGILGFVQWSLGNPAWGLWICSVMAAVAIALYILAQFGQKLAAWQTFLLHQEYEAAIGRPAEIR